jgi:AcrR family transcriptional regulator
VASRIDDIAVTAGVATPTVYKAFTNKRTLLTAVVERAMAGAVGESVEDQPWWMAQLEEADPGRQLELIAANARRIYERAAPVIEAVRAASSLDPEITQLWDDITRERGRRSDRTTERFLARAGRLARRDASATALTLLALTAPELYTAVRAAGQDADQYEAWLAGVLRAALLHERPRRRSGKT